MAPPIIPGTRQPPEQAAVDVAEPPVGEARHARREGLGRVHAALAVAGGMPRLSSTEVEMTP